MESTRSYTIVLILSLFCQIYLVFGDGPTVTLPEGTIVGTTVTFYEDQFINVTKQVDTFLGVPYAEIPLRFEKSRRKEAWTGTWNATSFAPSCFQFVDDYSYFSPPSEDCLYLNVYAPNQSLSELAPVMVWIHGGGFQSDTAMSYDYYGVPLVAVGDVIVVTINYRLSIFGGFSTGDEEARGNQGMLDQVIALQWIQDNIQAFGGDPDRVTIFGESAGGAAVNFHLLSPMSAGLFHQAILQSGNAVTPWAFELNPENDGQKALEVGMELECDTSNSSILITCLREKDAMELMTAAQPIYASTGSYKITIDGEFMLDTPWNLYDRGEFAPVPILTGFNKDEGTLTLLRTYPSYQGQTQPPHVLRADFENFVPSVTSFYSDDAILEDAVIQEYTDWTTYDQEDADYFSSYVDLVGDNAFGCPTDVLTRKHAEANSTVYKYYMTHGPSATSFFGEVGEYEKFTPWMGASHGDDVIFVFGLPFVDELADIHGHNLTDEEKMMSVQSMRYWTNFAKTGDPNEPNGEEFDSWPPYTIPELQYKELSPEFENNRAVRARQCHLLNEYLPTLAEFAGDIDEDERQWREDFASWQGDMDIWRQAFDDYHTNVPCDI